MRKIFQLGILMLALALCRPSFANMDHQANYEEHIQVMKEASEALKSSNPDLSKKLDDFVSEKEKMKDKWGGKDMQKHLEQKKEDVGKIKQASLELKGKNDSLSGDLDDMAKRWEKMIEEKEKNA
jgi:uncharacterized protein YukE